MALLSDKKSIIKNFYATSSSNGDTSIKIPKVDLIETNLRSSPKDFWECQDTRGWTLGI